MEQNIKKEKDFLMSLKACFWFVHPLDGDTNRYVAQRFEGRTGDYEHPDKMCGDDVRRDLWECPNYDLVTRLKNDQKRLSLKFQVFRRRGLYGPIEPWSLSEEEDVSKLPTQKSPKALARPRSPSARRKAITTLTETPGVMRGSQLTLPPQVG